MNKVATAQRILAELGFDGWLLYDFHKNNELAHNFLKIEGMTTRRFFYWIPVQGTPVKIVHAIEAHVLDAWPGEKRVYVSWQSLHVALKTVLQGAKRVAMEYSPNNGNPYVSRVDAGTVELIRSFGVTVVSSGNFLPEFTAVLSASQVESHFRAAGKLDRIVDGAWKWIRERLDKGVTEYDVQQKIVADYQREGLVADALPIVAVGAHSADPHYVPSKQGSSVIVQGDFILIDLWGKEAHEGAVFGDITRVAVAAKQPTARQQEIFAIVRRAQKAATQLVIERFAAHKRVEGWEVDDAARNVIREAGYGDFFLHRTGHNIEVSLHGSGASIDNLEMHDERPILPGTCFSIEPGIYLPGEFGVRLEYDIYVSKEGIVEVTGGQQDQVVALLA